MGEFEVSLDEVFGMNRIQEVCFSCGAAKAVEWFADSRP